MLLLRIFGQSAWNEGDVVLFSKTALCCLYSVVVGEQVSKCHSLWAGAHLSCAGRESMLVLSFRRLLICLGSKACALRKNCDMTPCETTAVNFKEDGLKHDKPQIYFFHLLCMLQSFPHLFFHGHIF